MARQETLVVWQDSYSIGLDEIDDQHRMLFDIMNRLWSAIVRNAETAELTGIIGDLERYTISHFTAEETFMRSNDYPDFDEHCKYHRTFVKRLTDEKEAVASGKQVSLDLLHFLRDWLVNHILVEDKSYAELFHKQKRSSLGMLGRFFQRFR